MRATTAQTFPEAFLTENFGEDTISLVDTRLVRVEGLYKLNYKGKLNLYRNHTITQAEYFSLQLRFFSMLHATIYRRAYKPRIDLESNNENHSKPLSNLESKSF